LERKKVLTLIFNSKTELDSRLLVLVAIVVAVVIVSILVFQAKYKTKEERDANMNRLYVGMGIAIVAVLAVGYLMMQGDDQENGFRSGVRSWWRKTVDRKLEGARAAKDAKVAAERDVKARQRAQKEKERAAKLSARSDDSE
jgi:hypothetical protein